VSLRQEIVACKPRRNRLGMTNDDYKDIPLIEDAAYGNGDNESKQRKQFQRQKYPSFACDNSAEKKQSYLESLFQDDNYANYRAMTSSIDARTYARSDAFNNANATAPPLRSDLVTPPKAPKSSFDRFTQTLWYRISFFVLCFISFPLILQVADHVVSIPLERFSKIASNITPGISFVYGTYTSFTLNELYNRRNQLQTVASEETALLSNTARKFLILLKGKEFEDLAVEACQSIIDQVVTFARSSRVQEIMGMIYCDPYGRLEGVLAKLEDRLEETGGRKEGLIGTLRGQVTELGLKRAKRLSTEGKPLPPVHYNFLNTLAFILLMDFVISNLATFDTGNPSKESAILFSVLCTVFFQISTFTSNLNNLFVGNYTIRRSTIAGNLLQTRWLISRQPFGSQINFDDTLPEGPGVCVIDTPGLGEVILRNNNAPFE